jgi:hypothetical protein
MPESGVRAAAVPFAIWLLVVVSLVRWRQGSIYSGGADPVVVIKALIQCVALLVAVVVLVRTRVRQPLGGRSLGLLLMIVAVSAIGAYEQGNLEPSAVVATRVVLLAATVIIVLLSFPARLAVKSLLAAMAVVGAFSALTGLGLMLSGGRLGGGIPPLSPNDIASLCGLPALGVLHEIVHGRASGRLVAVFVGLSGLVLATGSRTAIFALTAAMVVVLLHVRRPPITLAAMVLIAAPVIFAIVAYTPTLDNMVNRGDSASLITLNSRTISWEAVLEIPFNTWERWLGSGLSVKQIAVLGQYWDEQVFDSSWISVLAQAGLVGTMLLAVWVACTSWDSLRTPLLGTFTNGALLFILLRSVTENGLVDASVDFVVFFTLSVLLEKASAGARPFHSVGYGFPAAKDDLAQTPSER